MEYLPGFANHTPSAYVHTVLVHNVPAAVAVLHLQVLHHVDSAWVRANAPSDPAGKHA